MPRLLTASNGQLGPGRSFGVAAILGTRVLCFLLVFAIRPESYPNERVTGTLPGRLSVDRQLGPLLAEGAQYRWQEIRRQP